jgi:MFS family permease
MLQNANADPGNIASAVIMDVFKRMYDLEDLEGDSYASTKGWIVSMATAGAVFGCLACIFLTTRLGRGRTMQLGTLFYSKSGSQWTWLQLSKC